MAAAAKLNGGLATEMAKAMPPSDLLLATSFRNHAKEVVTTCETAQSQDVPVIAISDSSLSPLAKTVEILFAIPEDEYSFSRSPAVPMCLAQALMLALAARFETGPDAPDIPILSQKPIGKERNSESVQRWPFALVIASSFIQDRNRRTFPAPAWACVVTAE